MPIGFGILIGNIPFCAGMNIGVYEEGSVLSILYQGVAQGYYPPLIFLGIGAMTDFSCMLSNPRLILLGAAAQAGIFLTFLGALFLGFELKRGRRHRDHRRRRRPHRDLPVLAAGAASTWAPSPSPPTPTWRWCR